MLGRIRGWQRRQWHERSKAERVELQYRLVWQCSIWFFYVGWCAAPLPPALRDRPLDWALGGLLLALGAAQAFFGNRLQRQAVDAYLGRGGMPRRGLAESAALLGAVLAVTVALQVVHGMDEGVIGFVTLYALLPFGCAYCLVVPVRRFLTRFGAAGAAVVAAHAAATDITGIGLAALAGLVLLTTGMALLMSRCGAWTLAVLWEAERARETEARLAVAEERLRFGRDLHDVMGRNLAVIALKSELAVQLAQRGRPEAVTQMIEVQRLAQESQREVREVVRGYREIDLGAELAGAQGVLAAAGIDCTVTGSADGLPAPVQSALGWVVREAATNVLRHGDARHCAVRLRVSQRRAVLSVENDGAPEEAGGTGSGLAGLRERLAGIGGTLRAGPAGRGLFRLTAEVPLPAGAPGPGPAVRRPVSEVAS
ncbi:sensor histidine kinase [Streptomyces sp. NPDC051041]|uniref:sensor histidine kinase n=1 Tax=Streptomyces sp. NPDC051041 TaxID=3365640 RepID=UPI0037B48A5E